ncbi:MULTISPECIES: carbohydrate ABC transporter permease [unclassified Mesotoga]|uniref:carbohydrate ABC transporter permease n=1 Tax=unclassified Mesotoga TaxID=1184398 RepID=UPI000DA6D801|nr:MULTISPECIES: carbohydrate ABC transporter permease [unclassified Mesotoga]
MRSLNRAKSIRSVTIYGVLAFFSVVYLIPLFWMVSTSLKPDSQIMSIPMQWFPRPPQWGNYGKAIESFPFFRYFFNTVFLTVMNVLGNTVTASLVAYSFSKLQWRGRNLLFYITIATMFIPGQVLIIPVYILFTQLGWINTYLPLIVPAFCGGGAFNIFLLRQFFISIPDELMESARIDGASELRIFTRIVLPLSKPALFTVALFTVVFTWNDFFGPLIYLHDPSMWTLAIGLRGFQQQYSTNWNLLMAASTLTALPLIILYFTAQEKMMRGFTLRAGIR